MKILLLRDKKDNFLLELAEESNADFIITGYKNLLILGEYKNTKIITPKNFLNIIK